MRFISLFLGLQLLVSGLSCCAAPLKINYQGRLEESGQPAEGAKSFIFKIYDALSGGSLVWTSAPQSVTLTNGVFSAVLEAGATVNLSTDVFSGASFIEITVDGIALAPRQEMVSAPYALVARSLSSEARISLSNLKKDPSSSSTINTSTNAVDWTQLKNVPAGLTDGTGILSLAAQVDNVALSTGTLTVNLAAVILSTGAIQADITAEAAARSGADSALGTRVDNVAASTGTLTLNFTALALSTGPLSDFADWNMAYSWGDHSIAGYVTNAVLNNVTASTGTLTVDLAGVILSTGAIAADLATETSDRSAADGALAAQIDNVALSTGTLTTGLAAETAARSGADSAITAQMDSVAASTGILTADLAGVVLSTGPLANSGTWNGILSVGGPLSLPIATKTADYTISSNDSTILVDTSLASADVVITLPSAVGSVGRIYTVKNINDLYVVRVAPAGSENMDGWSNGVPFPLADRGDFVTCQSDGANWMIIGAYVQSFIAIPRVLWN